MESIDICANIERIKARITKACKRVDRNPEEVILIAVSKTKPEEMIHEAIRCGQIHFGENRVQELTDKMEHFGDDVQWHMIGTLQTNKIKYMVDRVNWIHSIPKKKALKEVEKRASNIGRSINTLIQVNISDEEQKSGCEPNDLKTILEYAQSLKWTKVRGLMGMASLVEDPELTRPQFRMLKELRDHHRNMETNNIKLDHLSMGMSNDFEVAVEEGSTMVRVGSAIFGERHYQ
jgi:pyridoxal phosphate enzyme (YggS family)